ncbi:cytochrome B6 [Prochlorococcus marinus]|uniref:cytochrome B6 n=1 Tax=Prochlorococcus marinus TaxID=1219 RepID=UPI0003225870|nr:cytochrome B6 [Prochlorococcus marinus]
MTFPTLLAYATVGDASNAGVLGLSMGTWMILTLIFLGISSVYFILLWFKIAQQESSKKGSS